MKIRRFVNERKRTCICILEDFKDDFIKDFLGTPVGLVIPEYFFEELSYPKKTIVGKAKCHTADTFNAEVGLQLAEERAMKKYARIYNKRIKEVLAKLIVDTQIIKSYLREED